MRNVLEYLEAAARISPGKTAFADIDESVTFAALLEKARRIGSALAHILPPGSPVPVFLPKSVKAVTVFLGAAYAGCFYSMLDRKQPESRLLSILDTLDAAFIVTGRTARDTDPDASGSAHGRDGDGDALFGRQALFFEDLASQPVDEALLAQIRVRATDLDPLYVNFTSGSTGVPKGVAVAHRSVIDFIDCFTEITGIRSSDVLGNQAPFDFDVSVKDIYSALKTGATVQIIPPHFFSLPTELLDFLADRSVTVLIWAVSALTLVNRLHGFTYRIPVDVKKVIFSGEVMPVKYLNEWRDALPDAAFFNVYGPTEITCNCTWYPIERAFDVSESIPIGRPFPNEKVFLLDGEDRLVESPGVSGEICVGGTALALGYYRNPEATAAAFVQNPLNSRYPERIYRTGDLAEYLPDGDLVFTGRKDFQIKHMGHRIELGEIERAMNALPEITAACCLFLRNRITAFYAGEIEKKELASRLKTAIPDYMVPGSFVQMDTLPVSKNGKIDRQALAGYGRTGRQTAPLSAENALPDTARRTQA